MYNEEKKDSIQTFDFDAIRLKVASPEDISRWSYGEVTRPETINYRTQRPEKDGLFSERIFGPTKDWECYCGKYKKIRFKGIVCDKCGVEVTRSIVRRERMGHIDLATPVSHIWFLRGVPSKIGLVLDISVQNLEKVIYFANFIITDVYEELKQKTLEQLREEFKTKKRTIENESNRKIQEARSRSSDQDVAEKAVSELAKIRNAQLAQLEEVLFSAEEEVKNIKSFRILSETTYRDLSLKYGHLFHAGIGAEIIHKLLQRLDLKALERTISKETENAQGIKKEKLIRRSRLIRSLIINKIKPEWMILTRIPIIPPDLRPMVALDGGRFATSDLNDLYRRVINRNNRLKQLLELKAPEVICRNEKRMLQEAVDALIDNAARHGKTVMASTGQKRMLKSIADMLKGKRGRFRQNLLGKRIDYSGRSVIVVGPTLKLHECGLPKRMALDLFKPFVMGQLIKQGFVYNVRSASRFIESGRDEVWDILEEIVKNSTVLLNRAPTLHRLGIQAFRPKLIEGKAIQIHPLVCSAFNADFDGDQMAVHVPLSDEARAEGEEIMLASRNLLKPAIGQPISHPNQDIVWGGFYMTFMSDEEQARTSGLKMFANEDEAVSAYTLGSIALREKIIVRPSIKFRAQLREEIFNGSTFETTVGRIIFHKTLPDELFFYNTRLDKKMMGEIIARSIEKCGMERTAKLLDEIKELCGRYLTKSGLSFGMDDIPVIASKEKFIKGAEDRIKEVETHYDMGLLTFQERKNKIITIWTEVRDTIAKLSKQSLNKNGSVYSIIESQARGSWAQLNQIIGMKGLLASPSGEIIELAVKSSFKEGLDVLEYFISTHGARKGLADTALRTSSAGYLTRRLVDVAQDVVVNEHDCGDKEGFLLTKKECDALDVDFYERLLGRTLSEDISNSRSTFIFKKNESITKSHVDAFKKSEVIEVRVRSLLTCKTIVGVCQRCYGFDLAYNEPVKLGTAVGIIAAQSLGEPGTQLTMRTFHTGGVAGADITQGLPRVEELFEARSPKVKALISEVSGSVSIHEKQRHTVDAASGKELGRTAHGKKIIAIAFQDSEEDIYRFQAKKKSEDEVGVEQQKKRKSKKTGVLDIKITDGREVNEKDILFISENGVEVRARRGGVAVIEKNNIRIRVPVEGLREYSIPISSYVLVKNGDHVTAGDQLTEGNLDLQIFYQYKGKVQTQKYVINEIQRIYSSQGQKLNDKHIEVIVRQMFSRIDVLDAGETDLLPSETIERAEFLEANKAARKDGRREAKGQERLMGITKASLSTRSWLSAASFQETARVLINAAVSGKVDHLQGLKENVIIGRLIPVGTGYQTRKKRV